MLEGKRGRERDLAFILFAYHCNFKELIFKLSPEDVVCIRFKNYLLKINGWYLLHFFLKVLIFGCRSTRNQRLEGETP